eukprot:TRINITY_DN48011_c0_g1_i1.p1 TRINITY_DN48011_c0_g1~~TRINITY_DN48011_c0_g1_i1.p1  ORF type:complete len:424 (+),score=155.32 TRINITY_DN48011_c0_g1_i1:69-1274(+)
MAAAKLRAKLAALEHEQAEEQSRALALARAGGGLREGDLPEEAPPLEASPIRRLEAASGRPRWPLPAEQLQEWAARLAEREAGEQEQRGQCQARLAALAEKRRWVIATRDRLERQQRELGVSRTLLAAIELPQPEERQDDGPCPRGERLETEPEELYKRKLLHRDLARREQSLERREKELRTLPLHEAAAARCEQKLLLLERDLAHALDACREHQRAEEWVRLKEQQVAQLREEHARRAGRIAADRAELVQQEAALRSRAGAVLEARPGMRSTALAFRPDLDDPAEVRAVQLLPGRAASDSPVLFRELEGGGAAPGAAPAGGLGSQAAERADAAPTVHACRRLHEEELRAAQKRQVELSQEADCWTRALAAQDTEEGELHNRRSELYQGEINLLAVRGKMR